MSDARPKLTIKIPTALVPPKDIPYEEEVLSFLGVCTIQKNTLDIDRRRTRHPHPPTAAVYALLEVANARWICDADASLEDRLITLYIMAERERALDVVADAFRSGDRTRLLTLASDYVCKHQEVLLPRLDEIYRTLTEYAQLGFEMIPPDPSGKPEPMWFSARYLAQIVYLAGTALATPPFQALWRLPLTMIGHVMAVHNAAHGQKHIERPPDVAALDKMVQEAEDREYRGELHPWQKIDPIGYPLSQTQVDARFEIVEEFNEILKSKGL